MAQGQAYKQTLLSQIDRVRDLISNVDQEAAVSLQYRMRDLEKLSQTSFTAITKQMDELKEQQKKNKNFQIDEATRKDFSNLIGQAAAEYAINSLYSHLSSNPGLQGRIRGKSLDLSDQGCLLTKQRYSTTTDYRGTAFGRAGKIQRM